MLSLNSDVFFVFEYLNMQNDHRHSVLILFLDGGACLSFIEGSNLHVH